jgi:hypothetical protein
MTKSKSSGTKAKGANGVSSQPKTGGDPEPATATAGDDE